jgi:hypothetical protein
MTLSAVTQYATPAEGDQHMSSRLHTESWDLADENEKDAALLEMSRKMDRLRYVGRKTVLTQLGEFPRKNVPGYADDVVPNEIKLACIEGAYALLDGIDTEKEFKNLRATNEGLAAVRRTYSARAIPAHVVALIPGVEAWNYLLPFLAPAGGVYLNRVS